jgi:hypothetical protein
MNCTVTAAKDLSEDDRVWIMGRLCRLGSDFQKKLIRGPTLADGWIAVVRSHGEIIGWARTEKWQGEDTLEAFVAQDFRGLGVATFAATGLRLAGRFSGQCAVFAPPMLPVAVGAGLDPVLFEKDDEGGWKKSDTGLDH